MERYKTVMVYKKSRRRITIDTGLTKAEAMKQVEKDIEINPNATTKMLVFYKQ